MKLLGVSVINDCKYLIALHRYRKGHGFKSRTGLNFFQALFSLLLKSVHYCEDRFHIQISVMLEFSTFFSYLFKLSWNQKKSFDYEWNGYRKNGIEAKLHIISSSKLWMNIMLYFLEGNFLLVLLHSSPVSSSNNEMNDIISCHSLNRALLQKVMIGDRN